MTSFKVFSANTAGNRVRDRVLEFLLVTTFGVVLSLTTFRDVFFSPGILISRDYFPPFYFSPPSFFYGLISPIYFSNPFTPIFALQWAGVLPPSLMSKVGLMLFPIGVGVPSMYYSSRYFLGQLAGRVDLIVRLISLITSVLFVLWPTVMYYSYWNYYSAFVILFPLLLASLDCGLRKGGILGSTVIGLASSLTVTDPRGFLFTLFTVLLYTTAFTVIRRMNYFRTLLLSVPLFLAINIRTFISLAYYHGMYTGVSLGISDQQLWLNYRTYSLADDLRGLGLFRPPDFFPPQEDVVGFIVVYALSFTVSMVVILGTAYYWRRLGHGILFSSLFFLLITLLLAKDVFLIRDIPLDLLAYLNNLIKDTPLFPYMWTILPTYLEELVPGPMFIAFSGVLYTLASSGRVVSLLLLSLSVIGGASFSLPETLSGNFLGQYQSYVIPQGLQQIAQYLLSHNPTGTVASYVFNTSFPPEEMQSLPHGYLLPVYLEKVLNSNMTELGKVLNFFGVQYLIVQRGAPNSSIISRQSDLELVMNNSFGCLYRNLDFYGDGYSRELYVLAGYPSSLGYLQGLPRGSAVVPIYDFPNPSYVAGVIGGGRADLYAVLFRNFSVNLHVQRLPSPTNFTDTFYPTVPLYYAVSQFPGVSFYQVINSSSLYIHTAPGKYYVIMTYLSFPGSGWLGVASSNQTYEVDTAGNVSVRSVVLGPMQTGERLELFHNGSQNTFLVNIEVVPMGRFNTTWRPSNVTVFQYTYPVEGAQYSSPGYVLSIGHPAREIPDLVPILTPLNLATATLGVLAYLYLSRRDLTRGE